MTSPSGVDSTDAHLTHANDLSDWIIEPLGAGKHLMQAKKLEPRYATIDPDPATLAKARSDFGGMLLTPEIIADNPPAGTQPHFEQPTKEVRRRSGVGLLRPVC